MSRGKNIYREKKKRKSQRCHTNLKKKSTDTQSIGQKKKNTFNCC